MVPCFLDEEVMGEPMGHGSRAFVPDVNPIWTKEQTHDFLTIHLFFFFFFFDPHNLSCFVHKYAHCENKIENFSLLKKFYVLMITRDPHM
jgi:hypothetical protein